jgi:hypothetical protein
MEHENYIHIDNSDRGTKIYRIMSVDYLLDMFETKTNVLVKPSLWDDPSENFLFNTPMVQKNGTEYVSILRDRAYGQCWSLNVESDAMWRIYAPKKNGVKIQTTISSLFNSLYQDTARYPKISCFIGKVDYYPKKKLTNLAKEIRDNGKSRDGSYYQAKSLMMKRIAFKHEEEVRLIYLDPCNLADRTIHKYRFDPFSHVKSMTFDPRMGESLYRVYRKHIESLGFTGKIIQSGLYKKM